MFREIDLSLMRLTPRLEIVRPNNVTIGNLKEANQVRLSLTLGQIHTLSFEIPYEIEKRNKMIPNPNIEKTKERFLIHFKLGHLEMRFIITEIDENMDDKDKKRIVAKSLENELKNKLVRGYQTDPVNIRQVMTDMEKLTIWKVGNINPELLDRKRGFDVSEKTLLDFIYEIATTFDAIVEFDTINRIIHFRTEEEIRKFRGMRVSYGNLLKQLNRKSDPSEMITRLHCYGGEELSINRVNPTGTSYIEDFTFFLDAFSRDENKNTLSSSEYMSDGLCHAILDYQELVESKKGEFSNLLAQQDAINIVILNQQGILATKRNELVIIEDQIDIAKGMGEDTTQLRKQRNDKQKEIDDLIMYMEDLDQELQGIIQSIVRLKDELSIENNFTPEQIVERDQFIIERTWSDDNYFDDEELYRDGLKKFDEYRLPRETFNISIVNFFEVLEEQKKWNKLYLGEDMEIYYDKFKIDHRAMILSMDLDFENQDIRLEISDVKSVKDKNKKLAELIKNVGSTSTTINMSKYKWDKSSKDLGEINDIINNVWDATARSISAGVNNSIDIGRRGIIITSPDNPNHMLIIQSGQMAISKNGGEDWTTAINADGVFAEVLMGKLIAGVNLIIENESGSFRVDGEGIFMVQTFTHIADEEGNNLIDRWNSAEENANNYTNNVVNPVAERVTNVETAISDGTITNSVLQSTEFTATIDGITDQIGTIDERQTQMEQNFEEFNFNISQSGGVNMLRNSLGFGGMSFWTTKGLSNRVRPIQNDEISTLGYASGFVFQTWTNPVETSIEQRVIVTPNEFYTLSGLVKKMATDSQDDKFEIIVYNDDETVELGKATYESGFSYDYEPFTINFYPLTNRVIVKLICGNRVDELYVTGLMLNVGNTPFQWTNHAEEVYNSNVRFDINGIRVSQQDNGVERGYTQITPSEFAGYWDTNDDGEYEKIFYLNGEETVSKSLRALEEFTMDTVKIISVDSAQHKGWAFVPVIDVTALPPSEDEEDSGDGDDDSGDIGGDDE